VKYYYTTNTYSIRIYREPTAADEKDDEEKEETPEARERRERGEKLDALARTAYSLRQSFVKNFKPQKKHHNIIATFAAVQMVDSSSYWQFESKVLGFLGMVTADGQTPKSVIMELIEAEPERLLFVMSYLRINEYESDDYHDHLQMYTQNEKIDKAYAILEQIGYVMSDDEKALQDGTHELYRPEDPCYRCKSAHWECDGCCNTCEDRCNGGQRCRLEKAETPSADRVCRECGGLDDDIIDRGDSWVDDDLCSSCADPDDDTEDGSDI
jgi:ParB family chromosome partitioning protein